MHRKQMSYNRLTRTHSNTYTVLLHSRRQHTFTQKQKKEATLTDKEADRPVGQMCVGPGGAARSARPGRSYLRPRDALAGKPQSVRAAVPRLRAPGVLVGTTFVLSSCRLGIWLLLLVCAVSLGLVCAFLLLSLFYALWLGTDHRPSSTSRRGPNSKRQLSAYSVFNPGCQALPGALKAEQLERELMYGPAGCK
uniref:SAYSvFN domain-containing protein n=1 Tax=Eptatretus burgeri TaxID=7764 RepID=A0A8C4R165_EPTBU